VSVERQQVKFSILDAARRSGEVVPLLVSPARKRTLHAAAILWCRNLTLPTIRQIAAEAGRSPVTVLQPFDTLLDVYAHVLQLEWEVLRAQWFEAARLDAAEFLRGHAAELGAEDRSLLRLPSLVHAAIAGARPAEAMDLDADRVVPLYALAAAGASPPVA
jgi:predicted transcriptional regulator